MSHTCETGAGEATADMAKQGNVAGLLAHIRSKPFEMLPPDIMDQLARSVRKLGGDDLSALINTAFTEILAFGTLLLVRCQLHVERRLGEADGLGGDPYHLPVDLDREGWIERVERISRFISEMAATRARVLHVDRLNRKSEDHGSTSKALLRSSSPFDADRHSVTSPGNGNVQVSNGRPFFT